MKLDKEELEKVLFIKTVDDELTLDDISEQIRERLEYIDISK